MILFGLETEYGITLDDSPSLDVVAESIALVQQATLPGVRMCWDYSAEDPHIDVRGFRVSALRQDVDEAGYFEEDTKRELNFQEIKSDLALGNGGRFYNDHAHPEYCTPECSTLDELSDHVRAGDKLVAQCAQTLSALRGKRARIYKNNTDYSGHSYGCHENYLIPRALSWDRLAQGLLPFMVTRQIFAGSGKFGVEAEDRFLRSGFQISQRSDFFSELQSVDTMQHRPLINTRDEPHANPKKYRRFHVILGDANMSPFATRLKTGATALILEALARKPELNVPSLRDPLQTLKSISHDPDFQWKCPLEDGSISDAVSIQFNYLKAAEKHCDLHEPWKQWTVENWEETLNDLRTDFRRCEDRLDWAAKRKLILDFQREQGLADDDPWLRSLDLSYHLLDEEEGLYFGWESAGGMREKPDPKRAALAMLHPPESTRALIRGLCIQKFSKDLETAQWDHATFKTSSGPLRISLLDLFERSDIVRYKNVLENAKTVEDLRCLVESP